MRADTNASVLLVFELEEVHWILSHQAVK
jgi:hypothetical protein